MPLPTCPGLFKGQVSLVSFDGETAIVNVAPDATTEGLMLAIPVPAPKQELFFPWSMRGRWPERADSNPIITHSLVCNSVTPSGSHWISVRLDAATRLDFWLEFCLQIK